MLEPRHGLGYARLLTSLLAEHTAPLADLATLEVPRIE